MVDSLDLQVLQELRKDCRASYRELAKRLNVATGTVQSRIKRLERDGVIEKYHAELNFSKLGYPLAAIIGVTGMRGKLAELKKRLIENKNVFGIYEVTGEYDLFIGGRFKNVDELSEFVRKELSPKRVERTTTFLILHADKEHHTLI